MNPTTSIRVPLLLFSITTAAACGSGRFATEPGDSVLVANATAFSVASSGGGFGGPALPPGAACNPGVWTYAVHLDTSQFVWDRCDVTGDATDPAAYMRSSGSRILPAADLEAARSAARKVHVSGESICGADKPTMHMTVSTPAGSMVYGDDFYSCTKEDEVYVISEELDALSAQLYALDQR